MKKKRWLKGAAYVGKLPVGCLHCSRGGKLVLLVTGKCSVGCYYCPLSFKKRGKAVTYADEVKVRSDSDILQEAELIKATGTGVTGGDPLVQPNETARLIKMLKNAFGSKHHVHLYTACAESNPIETVFKAGLDEIRFHPPSDEWGFIESTRFAGAVELSRDLGLHAGFEVPSLPNKSMELRSLIASAERLGADFVNLNELEFSYTNWKALRKRGFDVKNDVSNAVEGSERLARKLLNDAPIGLNVHYCSASFKDAIQLRRRLMRRARSILRPLDILTKDGTLVMGIIETKRTDKVMQRLIFEFGVPRKYLEFNPSLRRIEIASWILEDISMDLNENAFLVEEYPTADRLEVERERLSTRRR